jgi:hypothetical protein
MCRLSILFRVRQRHRDAGAAQCQARWLRQAGRGAGAGAGISFLLGGGDAAPSAAANAQIPPAILTLYQQAATTCPGLSWTLLAAIGTVESGKGTSDLPGVHSGANSAGAEGPMQFEPSTFLRSR